VQELAGAEKKSREAEEKVGERERRMGEGREMGLLEELVGASNAVRVSGVFLCPLLLVCFGFG
jgi:hypothetical protein